MKAVTFLEPTVVGSLYNKGDTAGFPDDVADGLITEKRAVEAKRPLEKATAGNKAVGGS